MKLFALNADQVVRINRIICAEAGNPHHCFDVGKVESAIHSAFYPGAYPFAAGGVANIAGALCFYLVKSHAFMDGNKRTATLAAMLVLHKSGWDLKYQEGSETEKSALSDIIEKCAAGEVTKEELMKWFDTHKAERVDYPRGSP